MSSAADALARRLGLPRVELFEEVGSTLDVAHELAGAGAPAGTLIIANSQAAGRGRMGRVWRSEPGAGVWLTVIERPTDVAALGVMSLRVGLGLAPALDALADAPIRLKWPNDLYVGALKVGGILIEVRWRESRPDWVAIGVGINLRPPRSEISATGLRDGVSANDVLDRVVPAIRTAAIATGSLTDSEIAAFNARDLAIGRRCIEPAVGVVRGIDLTGALRVAVSSDGLEQTVSVRAGSLVLQENQ